MGAEKIGENIRFIRKKNNLTQSEAAKLFKVTRGQFASYENGVTPRLDFISGFADYFNITIDDLIRNDLKEYSTSRYTSDNYAVEPKPGYKDFQKELREKEQLIKTLKEQLRDKEKIIHFLEEKLKNNSQQ